MACLLAVIAKFFSRRCNPSLTIHAGVIQARFLIVAIKVGHVISPPICTFAATGQCCAVVRAAIDHPAPKGGPMWFWFCSSFRNLSNIMVPLVAFKYMPPQRDYCAIGFIGHDNTATL